MQPVKQPKNYDQVHQASGFGAFELSQNPVFRLEVLLPTNRPQQEGTAVRGRERN
jgi:hypothetical protein